MTEQHTPGPWRFVETPYHERDAGIIETERNIYIAQVFRISGQQSSEVLANARLIAAAPAMLDALRGLLAAAREVSPERDEDESGSDFLARLDAYEVPLAAAEAAIAQATQVEARA